MRYYKLGYGGINNGSLTLRNGVAYLLLHSRIFSICYDFRLARFRLDDFVFQLLTGCVKTGKEKCGMFYKRLCYVKPLRKMWSQLSTTVVENVLHELGKMNLRKR